MLDAGALGADAEEQGQEHGGQHAHRGESRADRNSAGRTGRVGSVKRGQERSGELPNLAAVSQARQTRVVDGVKLGMSDCVVDDDGVFIAPSKMTTTELQVGFSSLGRRRDVCRVLEPRGGM